MAHLHPFMLLAFVLLAAVALTQVPQRASAPDGLLATSGPVGPRLVKPRPVEARPVETAVVREDAVAVQQQGPHPDWRARPTAVEAAVMLRAEPEPAVPTAATFVPAATFIEADTMLYAKDGARLRAAPSTAADIVTKLAADAPLRAVARSSDGVWWRVSLDTPAGEPARTGYVNKIAVSKNRAVPPKPPAAPGIAAAAPQSVPVSRSQSLLDTVDETVDWLVDAAGSGPPPPAVRTER